MTSIALLAGFASSLATGTLVSGGVLALIFGYPIAVAAHEAGHACAASFVGRQVARITVGRGGLLLLAQARHTRVELRRNLWRGGSVIALVPAIGPFRLASAVVLVGGAAANAVLAIALFLAASAIGVHTWVATLAFVVLIVLGIAQAFSAGAALVPMQVADSATDGLQLWRLLTNWAVVAPEARWLARAYQLAMAGQLVDATAASLRAVDVAPRSPTMLFFAIWLLARSRGDAEAVAWFLERGVRPEELDSSDGAVDLLTEAVAWSALRSARADLTEMIDCYSSAALAEVATRPALGRARGARLIELGDLANGVPILIEALRATNDAGTRADLCDLLSTTVRAGGEALRADAFAALGDHCRARQWLD